MNRKHFLKHLITMSLGSLLVRPISGEEDIITSYNRPLTNVYQKRIVRMINKDLISVAKTICVKDKHVKKKVEYLFRSVLDRYVREGGINRYLVYSDVDDVRVWVSANFFFPNSVEYIILDYKIV